MRESRLAVVGLQDPEAVPAEVHGHEVGDVVIILDHHQRLFGRDHPSSLPLPRRAGRAVLEKCDQRHRRVGGTHQ